MSLSWRGGCTGQMHTDMSSGPQVWDELSPEYLVLPNDDTAGYVRGVGFYI